MADCAMMLRYRQALILTDHALRLGADRSALQAMADDLDGRRGIRTFRRVLATADPRSESPGETLTRELIMRLRIRPPQPQLEVSSHAGRHRLDFAWKEEKVALEFDGKTKYFEYRPTAEVIFEERHREKALTEEGWRFVRVKWKDLFREQEFKSRLLRALAGRPGPERELAGARGVAGRQRRRRGSEPANWAEVPGANPATGTADVAGAPQRPPTPRSSVRAS